MRIISRKFLDELDLTEVQITPPLLIMLKISVFSQRFHVSCPWESKLLLNTCQNSVIFENYTIHVFIRIRQISLENKKYEEIEKKVKILKNWKKVKLKLKKSEGLRPSLFYTSNFANFELFYILLFFLISLFFCFPVKFVEFWWKHD